MFTNETATFLHKSSKKKVPQVNSNENFRYHQLEAGLQKTLLRETSETRLRNCCPYGCTLNISNIIRNNNEIKTLSWNPLFHWKLWCTPRNLNYELHWNIETSETSDERKVRGRMHIRKRHSAVLFMCVCWQSQSDMKNALKCISDVNVCVFSFRFALLLTRRVMDTWLQNEFINCSRMQKRVRQKRIYLCGSFLWCVVHISMWACVCCGVYGHGKQTSGKAIEIMYHRSTVEMYD